MSSTAPIEDVQHLLETARRLLDLDVVLLADVSGGLRTVAAVAGGHPSLPVGRTDALIDTVCHDVVLGQDRTIIPDVRLDPDTADIPTLVELGVAGHMCVPVTTDDGAVIATLCGMSAQPAPHLVAEDARVLRRIADRLAELVTTADPGAGTSTPDSDVTTRRWLDTLTNALTLAETAYLDARRLVFDTFTMGLPRPEDLSEAQRRALEALAEADAHVAEVRAGMHRHATPRSDETHG